MKRLYLFIPVLLFAFFFCSNSSAQSAFLKFDGVDGESTDASHKGWIDVLSFSQGASKPSSASTGLSRRRGSALLEDFVITKKLDKSSPKLADFLLKGRIIPAVTLELVNSGKSPYYKVVMSNVMINSFKNGGTCGNQCPVTEEISLSFERITWTYIDASGSITTSTYSVEKGM